MLLEGKTAAQIAEEAAKMACDGRATKYYTNRLTIGRR